jgi:hypothetical protein
VHRYMEERPRQKLAKPGRGNSAGGLPAMLPVPKQLKFIQLLRLVPALRCGHGDGIGQECNLASRAQHSALHHGKGTQ